MQHPPQLCPNGPDCYLRTIGKCVSKVHKYPDGAIACKFGTKCKSYTKSFMCYRDCLTTEDKAKCKFGHADDTLTPCKWYHPIVDEVTINSIKKYYKHDLVPVNEECPRGTGCPCRYFGVCEFTKHSLADRSGPSLCKYGIRCTRSGEHPDRHTPIEHEHFTHKTPSNRVLSVSSKPPVKTETPDNKSDSQGSYIHASSDSIPTPTTMSYQDIVSDGTVLASNEATLIRCTNNCGLCASGNPTNCTNANVTVANTKPGDYWPAGTVIRVMNKLPVQQYQMAPVQPRPQPHLTHTWESLFGQVMGDLAKMVNITYTDSRDTQRVVTAIHTKLMDQVRMQQQITETETVLSDIMKLNESLLKENARLIRENQTLTATKDKLHSELTVRETLNVKLNNDIKVKDQNIDVLSTALVNALAHLGIAEKDARTRIALAIQGDENAVTAIPQSTPPSPPTYTPVTVVVAPSGTTSSTLAAARAQLAAANATSSNPPPPPTSTPPPTVTSITSTPNKST